MDRLLAIDWGSSALRGALLDADGKVVDERAIARGMLTIAPGGFAEVFESQFGDWMDVAGTRCLMAGMVGSKQGWVEAAYCPAPAGLDEVARTLTGLDRNASTKRRDIAIVPGIACEHDGVPDVMRGEEIKVFGALDLLKTDNAQIVLPGTHSKWATVAGAQIRSFSTVMSGEFYALLRQHSILSRSLPADDGTLDEAAFDRGVRYALDGRSLLQTAFSVRTLALFERMPAAALPSYLSGLVIGEELRCRPLDGVGEVIVVGAPVLAERFDRALRQRGLGVRTLGEEAAWRGLWAIDRRRREMSAGPN
ncbi:MAG: 2-dehydro-3-deoxygalactonokinase [Pseudomonadota bacterium]|nr:2-dehydro-3-deoxygalactonokinase [Pseudomonadota bacterium]